MRILLETVADEDGAIALLAAIVRQAVNDATAEGQAGADARAWLDSFLGEYRSRLKLHDRNRGWPPGAWTVAKLAQAADLSKTRVVHYCNDGQINAIRVGGQWAIPEAEAQRLIDERRRRFGEVLTTWPPGAWTVEQLAQAAGISDSGITLRCKKREIKALRVGYRWAIPEDEARRFIQSRRVAA